MDKNQVEASVLVCTYNPNWDALKFTLDSLVTQKDIAFEIVITDDGSQNDLRSEIEDYFNTKHFRQWDMVCHVQNEGTICNIYSGLQICRGKYVKTISPGDALADNQVLRSWVDFNISNNLKWSFSDAVYYTEMPWEKHTVEVAAHPQNISVYQKKNDNACRWHYIVLDDTALGSAILGEKVLMLKYIQKILGKVKYEEDNIWRMMMFDGIVGGYYRANTVLYESGSGISSGTNSVWVERLAKDRHAADDIMLSCPEPDPFQKSIIRACQFKKGSKFRRLCIKGKIFFTLNKIIQSRKTDTYQSL